MTDIALPETPIEQLAGEPLPSIENIGLHHADRIAALARLLSQNAARARGDLSADFRPYAELPEQQRANMRAGVLRTLQALVLLGWIDPPA